MALTSKLSAIGDAIRAKAGTTTKYTLANMPTAIANIPTGATTLIGQWCEGTLKSLSASTVESVNATAQDLFGGAITKVDLPSCTSLDDFSTLTAYQSVLTKINLPSLNFTPTSSPWFSKFSALTSLTLGCTRVSRPLARYNTVLTEISLPACTSIDTSGPFEGCSNIVTANLPKVSIFQNNEFYAFHKLEKVDMSACTSISQGVFGECYSLKTLIIRQTSKVAQLSNDMVLTDCYHFSGQVHTTYNPDGLKDGYVYVPDALVSSYKTATNWSAIASQIKPLSELPTE